MIHHLEPGSDTVTDVFDAGTPPVLTIDPGDQVVVGTLDASGHLERQRVPGEARPQLLPGAQGHCLTGPILVRGAEPGAVLAVRFESLDPDDWGWTVAGARDTPLNRRLEVIPGLPSWLLWDLRWDVVSRTGIGTDQHDHRVRLAPFLGVVGVPPSASGAYSTIPPTSLGGGNIDCRALVAGSTLYLPVTVPGALLSVGDGHAAQGDGEVSGTAIECGMTSTLTVDLLDSPPVRGIHARTPDARITFGFDADLNEATAGALAGMLDWMQLRFGIDRSAALALASPTVDLRITQVANQTWGVHAILPDYAIG